MKRSLSDWSRCAGGGSHSFTPDPRWIELKEKQDFSSEDGMNIAADGESFFILPSYTPVKI